MSTYICNHARLTHTILTSNAILTSKFRVFCRAIEAVAVAEEGPMRRGKAHSRGGLDDKSLTGGIGTAMYVSPELEHAEKGTRYTQVYLSLYAFVVV